MSAIIYVIKHGLMWRDAPKAYTLHKTIYNRFIPWSRLGVFNRIFADLAGKAGEPERIMIDTTHLKAHRTAASLLKGSSSQTYRAHQRRAKLEAPCRLRWTGVTDHAVAGRRSDERPNGAFLLLSTLPRAKELLTNKGYDSDWFRAALAAHGITPCIPPRKNRNVQHHYDKELYRQRHKIENIFGRIKDWRRIATRYDRCAHTFMSAISIAATCCYWL